MRRFWVAWEGDYVKDAPKHVREQDVSDATNAWHKLRPSYYLSPEKWWKLLLKKQMQGGKAGYNITTATYGKH
jgi:hypothetical protein